MSEATPVERLRDVWRRRWRLSAAVAAFAFAAAAGAVLGLPNVYRATATVLIELEGVSETAPPAELESRLHVIGQEILTRSHVMELARRLDLYPQQRDTASGEGLLERFRRDVRVELKEAQEPGGGRGRTVSFTVSGRGTDPRKVADVTNAVADAYVQRDAQLREGTVQSLEAQVQQVRRQLDEQERRLGDMRGRQGEPAHQIEATLGSLERLNGQLLSVGEARVRAMDRRSALLKELAETDPGTSGDADATATRLSKLNQELAELRRRFTDKYPDVQRVKAEIATLERQATDARRLPRRPAEGGPASERVVSLRETLRETDDSIRTLRAEEISLKHRVEAFQRQVGEARNRVPSAPAGGPRLLEASRDYETTKALYTTLLKRHEEARAAAGAGRENAARAFRVLEPAVSPSEAVAPNRPRFLLLALMLALGAGIAAALLAEQLEATFQSVDDLRGFTRVPVLVSVPTLLTAEDSRRRRRRYGLAVVALLLGVVCVGQASYRVAHGSDASSLLSRGKL